MRRVKFFFKVFGNNSAYALIGVIILSGILSLSAIKGLKRSAARRAAIEMMKSRFEQQAFFRQVSKYLYNFHACGATLGTGGTVSAIKNHAGVDSLEVGKRYGRGYVKFEEVSINISGNSADFAVTASRYDKKKREPVGSIKKTYKLTIVRGPSSIEGCHIKDADSNVAKHNEQICNSIEAMSWNGSSCELVVAGEECPPQTSLEAIDGQGNFQCRSVVWKPDHGDWCNTEIVEQTTESGGRRKTKQGALASSWEPPKSSVCPHDPVFIQTEDCKTGNPPGSGTPPGQNRTLSNVRGTKCCDCNCKLASSCFSPNTISGSWPNNCLCTPPGCTCCGAGCACNPGPCGPVCNSGCTYPKRQDPGDCTQCTCDPGANNKPCTDSNGNAGVYDSNCNCVIPQCITGTLKGKKGDSCDSSNLNKKYDDNCRCVCDNAALANTCRKQGLSHSQQSCSCASSGALCSALKNPNIPSMGTSTGRPGDPCGANNHKIFDGSCKCVCADSDQKDLSGFKCLYSCQKLGELFCQSNQCTFLQLGNGPACNSMLNAVHARLIRAHDVTHCCMVQPGSNCAGYSGNDSGWCTREYLKGRTGSPNTSNTWSPGDGKHRVQ